MVSRTADVAVSALIAACLLAGALAQEPDESASFEACDSDSDFCTELQLRSKFEPADMVLEFTSASEETSNGNLRGNFVDSNPYLATLPGDGVGQNLVTLGACGVQTPHTHPRGTEFSYAVNGAVRVVRFAHFRARPGRGGAALPLPALAHRPPPCTECVVAGSGVCVGGVARTQSGGCVPPLGHPRVPAGGPRGGGVPL